MSRTSSDSVTVTADPRWSRVLSRDPQADGEFLYAVRTTGVFCRPSCPSRRPRPENVTFFANPDSAQRAGFRACQRCRPDRPADPGAEVARLCRLLDAPDEPPGLADLARSSGLSPFQVHRRFRAATGLSPKAFASGRRAERFRGALRSGRSVTEAIYEAGFGSSARVYQQADRLLGMTPSAFRAGGLAATIHFATSPCSLGTVLVGVTERGVCTILLGDDPDSLARALAQQFPRATRLPAPETMAVVVRRVVELVETPARPVRLPLDLRGTAFQLRVWEALTRIPAGRTVSYAELAAAVGAPTAARAVARACATNRLAVAIPCHRVIRGDGDLSGYRWGLERKRALLERERG
ncbi:MAG TPA: bifunctional DNA-binding transcriptional regulator/O6-methylguanine-DNA methyltransferase Ada [Polyangia bacterium]|nr:bifunctional DNA-binding transcriptional regulator/O6-methylguanine-DNA methyltransferase Ada [Polyangia bacterium]